MKATVTANSLSKAMKTCMSKSSSPRLVFNDDGVFVLSQNVPIIEVEGEVHTNGWGHVEFDRAQKIVQVLDIMGDRQVTLSYDDRRWVKFEDLRL